ncbi:MAG: GNAT family N-acetyltransferase [Candidatus Odinarchaeota archaeon]
MPEIKQISSTDRDRINECINLVKGNYLDNLVLLGDLYPPCNRLTRVTGIFDNKGELISFFTVFNGFQYPSIVLPHGLSERLFVPVLKYLKKEIPGFFTVVSFKLTEKDLSSFFVISEVSNEQCMLVTKNDQVPLFKPPELKKYQSENFELVDTFYKSINQYPWNPVQLESGFYHYIEIDGRMVAGGGMHLETPRLVQLGNIYVLPDYRGRGLGRTLVSSITHEVLKQKEMATLFVVRDNVAAISLYQKLGYRFYKPVKIIACHNPITGQNSL